MGIIIEFFSVPTDAETAIPADITQDYFVRSVGKSVGSISINSLVVAVAFEFLLQTELAGLAGDGSDPCRTVFVAHTRYRALEAQIAAWNPAATDTLIMDLGLAITDAIAEVEWLGTDMAVVST